MTFFVIFIKQDIDAFNGIAHTLKNGRNLKPNVAESVN